ncbi:MAG TPA: hypothetical protein VL463_27520 [Kofleriaceae bacterium]|nr:hypothetical protein [Kofleriaceae bacterium]
MANPALAKLAGLVGEWTTEGTHPMVPGKTFHGRVTFEWIEDGAFLRMRSRTDEPEIPDGVAVFGSDDEHGTHSMLYFDERKVSRRYEVEVRDDGLRWSRDSSKLAQRYDLRIVDGGARMIGKGELSRDGASWEGDLSLTYERR